MGVLTFSCFLIFLIPSHIFLGAPILSCVHKGVPGIFMDCHMMVAQPEKVVHFVKWI